MEARALEVEAGELHKGALARSQSCIPQMNKEGIVAAGLTLYQAYSTNELNFLPLGGISITLLATVYSILSWYYFLLRLMELWKVGPLQVTYQWSRHYSAMSPFSADSSVAADANIVRNTQAMNYIVAMRRYSAMSPFFADSSVAAHANIVRNTQAMHNHPTNSTSSIPEDCRRAGANINQRQWACNYYERVQPVNCEPQGDEMVFQVLKLSHRLKLKDRGEDDKRHTKKLRLSSFIQYNNIKE
ncbi:hypothetical protein Tco_1229529 [Tanacetum coccineum]